MSFSIFNRKLLPSRTSMTTTMTYIVAVNALGKVENGKSLRVRIGVHCTQSITLRAECVYMILIMENVSLIAALPLLVPNSFWIFLCLLDYIALENKQINHRNLSSMRFRLDTNPLAQVKHKIDHKNGQSTAQLLNQFSIISEFIWY